MSKIIFILVLLFLPSLYCLAQPDTFERLGSFQANIDAQRTNAAALIDNSNLGDSVKNKNYCVFYTSGCRGIGGWVIVIDNGQYYNVYYTDSNLSSPKGIYKTVILNKDNEEMQLVFSQKSLKGSNMKIEDREFSLTYYYFGLFGNRGNLIFYWNQSLLFHDVKTQQKIIRVFIKYIMPFIV